MARHTSSSSASAATGLFAVLAIVMAALITTTIVVRAQEKVDFPGIRNYTKVDASVSCGGATSVEALAALGKEGFASVVNLRLADEQGVDIPAATKAAETAGMKYFHLPLNGRSPDPMVIDRFLEIVTDPANQPVYIHCGSANRVGAVWLVKRVKVDGWSVERATEEAELIGLRSPGLKEFAMEYLKMHP